MRSTRPNDSPHATHSQASVNQGVAFFREKVAPGSDWHIPVQTQQLVKYGYKERAECALCKKAHEESGSSWKRELPKETIGHMIIEVEKGS